MSTLTDKITGRMDEWTKDGIKHRGILSLKMQPPELADNNKALILEVDDDFTPIDGKNTFVLKSLSMLSPIGFVD